MPEPFYISELKTTQATLTKMIEWAVHNGDADRQQKYEAILNDFNVILETIESE